MGFLRGSNLDRLTIYLDDNLYMKNQNFILTVKNLDILQITDFCTMDNGRRPGREYREFFLKLHVENSLSLILKPNNAIFSYNFFHLIIDNSSEFLQKIHFQNLILNKESYKKLIESIKNKKHLIELK